MDFKQKTCNICQKLKPLYEFYRIKGKWDGLSNRCKECYNKGKKPTDLQIMRQRMPEDHYDVNTLAWRRPKRDE